VTIEEVPAVVPERLNGRGASTPDDNGVRYSWSQSRRFVPRAFVQPALQFMRQEAASGIVMLIAAVAALVWANSPWHQAYSDLWATHVTIDLGGLIHLEHLEHMTLGLWVNDALMTIFFFVVGLEIKREIVRGELRDPKAVALPAVAALGGMIVPASIYFLINEGGPGAPGWGIPMATDIAFAVGVLSLLGRRVPIQAKLFLLTLAVVDDIGAIMVIAVFYTERLAVGWLLAAIAGLLLIAFMNRRDVRSPVPILAVGAFVWLAMLESGVHATLAGVAIGLIAPSWSFYDPKHFADNARPLVDEIDNYMRRDVVTHDAHERVQSLLHEVTRLTTESISPLDRALHRLELWSAFVVIPIFAFANAGVRLVGTDIGALAGSPVTIGVFLGLIVGKLVGVAGASWLAIKLGVGRLPRGTTWRHMVGVGLCAGIGFTVALFVTTLAFSEPGPADAAKVGIFAASCVAGIAGYLWLRGVKAPPEEPLPEELELAASS
jgi:Na+:H+ antiporter, NhaA family